MRTLKVTVRYSSATDVWIADCPHLAGVRASGNSVGDVIRELYSLIPPEWRLSSQRGCVAGVRS